jgi:2-(1,2-epoxy-1,2-dihydrophenyl)acetyl-CoA isomerase
MTMPYEQITVDREGTVAWITLSRPDRLNALTATMSGELESAFRDAGTDERVRCVVLTGAGRGFCAGQDLTEFEAAYRSGKRPDIAEHLRTSYHRMIPVVVQTPKPVIAATKSLLQGAPHLTLQDALEKEAAIHAEMGRTADHLEGVNAFVEKREPRFEGR